jgi:uncharacterized protein (DUF1330 family)
MLAGDGWANESIAKAEILSDAACSPSRTAFNGAISAERPAAMPAYMIFIREEPVRDAAALAEYQRLNRENTGDFKLKPLVVYGAIETVEGKPADGVVILEFPTVEDAKAWYGSPGYQSAVPHRLKGAEYRAILVQGLERASPTISRE